MKKSLLLGVGSLTSAVLPIVAIASCSSTEVPKVGQEDIESAAALLTDKPVLDAKKGESAETASQTITDTETLKLYYAPAVVLPAGIEYVYKSDTVSGDTVVVVLTVQTKPNVVGTTPKDKTITISGFKTKLAEAQDNIESAAALLVDKAVLDAKKGETAETASNAITDTETLKLYYAPVEVPVGIEYVYKSNTVSEDTVSVVLTIRTNPNIEGATPKDKTVVISGFKTKLAEAQDNMNSAVALLIDKAVLDAKKGELATEAANSITNHQTFHQYYGEVQMPTDVSYAYVSDSVVGDDVAVKLNVTSAFQGITPREVTVKILQLSTLLDREVARYNLEVQKIGDQAISTFAKNKINDAPTHEEKLAALKTWATVPEPSNNRFSIKIGRVMLGNPTSKINVIISVTDSVNSVNQRESKTKDAIMTITGFAPIGQDEIEAERFNISTPNTLTTNINVTEAIRRINSATSQEDKLTQLKGMANVPTPKDGYTLNIQSASVSPENSQWINVVINVLKSPNNTTISSVKFTITGFLS